MQNLDLDVLKTLLGWRQAGKRAMLATVVRTWGSSPRPVGSIMAMCEDGRVIGSVSGGCIEDDLIRTYANPDAFPQGPPEFIKYGITADEAHRFGLPCGGTIELLLEYEIDRPSLEQLVTTLCAGALMRRTVSIRTGEVVLAATELPADLQLTDTTITNTFGPEFRMLLIGAGQLSACLATMALFNGFSVTICDPRKKHSSQWSLDGVNLVTDMPDDVVLAMKLDRRSCVVALTHDPKLDDLALIDALATPAFYIGAIGSRRNSQERRARLMKHFGYSAEALQRLRGPIGIYIGSKTPSEIAVSIMAEILAVKNNVTLPDQMDVTTSKEQAAKPAGRPGVCTPSL